MIQVEITPSRVPKDVCLAIETISNRSCDDKVNDNNVKQQCPGEIHLLARQIFCSLPWVGPYPELQPETWTFKAPSNLPQGHTPLRTRFA
jgi:hypothetical protein